ncbi:energy transducer TonB [Novosphingobium sp.]|uniref:energy transducer TonB n=1 Tax=Novosphingobium sp. TaxID=1874826 RepID=UPI002625532F|nr:energy transducer TonB [Novosphingobium sp.]
MISALVLALSAAPVIADYARQIPGALPRSATPLNNPATWVTTADYPSDALRANAEGITEFVLTIGPEGRVTECRIKGSSGSPVLDQTTCDLIRVRSRFAPARDPSGAAMAGTYSNRVRWTIPRPAPPQAGELTISFLVSPDGARSDCRVETAVGAAQAMVARTDPCKITSGFSQGYVDEAGKPVSRRVRSTVKFEVLPVP